MKRTKLATVLGVCTAISMITASCSSGKKETGSTKGSKSTEAEEVETETEIEESGSEQTESTVTASSEELPSDSTEDTTAVQPSEATPIVLDSIQAGDVITFGSCEQDNNTSNGAEDIEWIVAGVEDGRALLLSKYVIAGKPFNSAGDCSWEESELRQWLNGEFYEAAFNDSEKSSIYEVELETKDPTSTVHYITTTDKVFLLEFKDIGKYFESEYWDETYNLCEHCFELITSATPYAAAQGAYNMKLNDKTAKKTVTEHPELKGLVSCQWWLRETGAFCSTLGSTIGTFYWEPGDPLTPYYYPSDREDVGVRPAVWVAVETSN